MQRRKFVVGLGSLAAGGAATMGTGAFSFGQTDRQAYLDVTSDAQAYFAFRKGGENGEHAEINNGQIRFYFNDLANVGGNGINPESVYLFDDVARIVNQGTQEIELSVPDTTSNGFWSTNFVAYVGDGTGTSKGTRQSIWSKDGKTANFDDQLNNRAGVSSLSDLIDTGPDSVTVSVGSSVKFGVALAAPKNGSAPSKNTGITLRGEET